MNKATVAVLMATVFMATVSQAAVFLYAVDSSRTELYNGTTSTADTIKSDSSKLTVRSDYKACKSWIEFDISDIDVGSLTNARLRVTLHEPKDSTCLLSAVNDNVTSNYVALDGFVTWNTGPGNFTSSDGISPDDYPTVSTNDLWANLNTNETTLIGTIDYSAGDGGLAGDQFFIDVLPILQADTDGYVLFVLHGAGGNSNFATHDHSLGADYWPALEVEGLPGAQTGELYNVQLNFGDGSNAEYVGPAHIGYLGDVWNNPTWVGVTSNPPVTNVLFSGVTLLDSTGGDNGVTATMTTPYNDGLDWDYVGDHVFNNYTSRNAGSPNPAVLMTRVINVKQANSLTLSISGLPADVGATVYVYGAGNELNRGATWSLAVSNQTTNGITSATTLYNGLSDGRDLTLTNSQGSCWEVISGTTDSSGDLTIDIDPNLIGQIYIQGLQVQLDLPPDGPTAGPVIESIEVSGSNVTLSWTAENVGVYSILRKTDLDATNWFTVVSNLPPGNLTTNVTASGADAEFYQIKGE